MIMKETVGFTTTYAISVPINTIAVSSNPTHGKGVLDTTLCDKVPR